MCQKILNFAGRKKNGSKMTPAEYIQLKAFARIDGALLALMWTASFACYIVGLKSPFYGMFALLLMVATPFYVAGRLRRFRDKDLNGVISLLRGWAFVILVFFYAGILLALVQYVYFAFMDHGYLLSAFQETLSSSEAKQALEQYGITESLNESIQHLGEMRPIDYALNVLTVNITLGILLGLPVAAMLRKVKK